MTPRTTLLETKFVPWIFKKIEEARLVTGAWPDFQYLVMGVKMKESKPNSVSFRKSNFMAFTFTHCDTVLNNIAVDKPEEETTKIMEEVSRELTGTKEAKNGLFQANWNLAAFPKQSPHGYRCKL